MAKLPSLKTLKRRPKRVLELAREMLHLKAEARVLEDKRQRVLRRSHEIDDLLCKFETVVKVVAGVAVCHYDYYSGLAVSAPEQERGDRRTAELYPNAHEDKKGQWGVYLYEWPLVGDRNQAKWPGAHHSHEAAIQIAEDWVVHGVTGC